MAKKFQEQFNLPTDVIDWGVVEEVAKFQEEHELKIAPKLTVKTLEKGASHFGKMDVGCAHAVFQRDTAAVIEFMVAHHNYPEEYLTTAYFIELVARWWSIMKARCRSLAFSHKNVEIFNDTIEFLQLFMAVFASLIIFEGQYGYEDVQIGVLMATFSVLWLQEQLLSREDVEFFMAGRVSGDPVECHHGKVRSKCKNPTCLQIERISKALATCQILGKVKGSNVPDDETPDILSEFQNIKKLEMLKLEEEQQELQDDFPEYHEYMKSVDLEERDFESDKGYAEANSLSYWIGCVLKRTILNKRKNGSFCKKCISLFIQNEEDETEQLVNELIDFKTLWDIQHLIKPSVLCNTVLHEAESMFKATYLMKKKLDRKSISFIEKELRAKYDNLPQCHFNIVLGRFLRGRMHFWSGFLTAENKKVNKKAIEEATNASRTTRGLYLTNQQVRKSASTKCILK